MKTILIRGSDYATPRELHAALRRMLDLPDYYGMNADALNDCLSELPEPVALWIGDPGEGDTAAALKTVARVFRDNGGSVRNL